MADATHDSKTTSGSRRAPVDRADRQARKVCTATGNLVEYWGFKSIHGRVWSLLAIRREPMSQTEIAELLGVSRSLVSTTITELTDFGLVRPTAEHRNAPYEAVMNVWPVISDVLRQREWMLLETARMSIEGSLDDIQLSGSDRYDPERLKVLLSMIEGVQKLLRLVVSIRMPDTAAEAQDWIANMTLLIESLNQFSEMAAESRGEPATDEGGPDGRERTADGS